MKHGSEKKIRERPSPGYGSAPSTDLEKFRILRLIGNNTAETILHLWVGMWKQANLPRTLEKLGWQTLLRI